MAFVHDSPKRGPFDDGRNGTQPVVGPGSYDIESKAHKELMQALYPKKTAPFNQTEAKNLVPSKGGIEVPGKYSISVKKKL